MAPIGLFALALTGAATAFFAFLAGPLVESLGAGGTRMPSSPLVPLAGLVAAVLARALGSAVYAWSTVQLEEDVTRDVRVALVEKVRALDPGALASFSNASLGARIAYEASTIRSLVEVGVAGNARNVGLAIALATLAVRMEARLATLALGVVPVLGLAVGWLARRARDASSTLYDEEAALSSRIAEDVSLVPVLRAARREEAIALLRCMEIERLREASARAHLLHASIGPGIEAAAALTAGTFVASGLVATLTGRSSGSATLSAFVALLLLYRPLQGLLGSLYVLVTGRAALDRVQAFLALPERPRLPATPVGDGPLVFDDVWFGHGERAVLAGASAVFEPGRVTALVGPSGAGKSTLLALAAGLYMPSRGAVRLAGVDVRAAAGDAGGGVVALLTQEPRFRAASLLENVALDASEPDRASALAACRAVGLEGVVASRPGGLDSSLDESGAGLSVGELQRLGLARALHARPKVLLLDEPTAALDDDAERQVLAAIRAAADDGAIVILATHRASTLAAADRVLSLRSGRLEPTGVRGMSEGRKLREA